MTGESFKSVEGRATISWGEWGEEAFARAAAENKPILLFISGSWCHWCHVMEETTYSDAKVIEKIEEHHVPIKVDTDRRPDINARYNMGGWPSTVFLTPAGEIIRGGTYFPPAKMLEMMESVALLFQEYPHDFDREPRGKKAPRPGRDRTPLPTETYRKEEGLYETETFADLIGFVAEQLESSFDTEYGGFGGTPKFPRVEALEFSQLAFLYEGGEHWEKIFTHTLRSMYSGGIFDPVEGGFFRYSTTRDWSIPHYEKMLEDNARLLSVLLTSYKLTADQIYAQAAREVLMYLKNNLYLPETQCWAGSQEADEQYYDLPLEKREQRGKPPRDKTIYVNWNACLISSLLKAAVILAEPHWQEQAFSTLEVLSRHCYEPGKGMAHFLIEGEKQGRLWGLLEDQAAMGLALSAAYQHSGEQRWLEMGRSLAKYCLEQLSLEGGGLRDKAQQAGELGLLTEPRFDLAGNSIAARWFVELSALTGEEAYLEKASDIVYSFIDGYQQQPLLSAGLALAALGVRETPALIEIVGAPGDPNLQKLHDTALAEVVPPKVVRLSAPGQQAPKMKEGYKDHDGRREGAAAAYACLGSHCFQPAHSPAELQQVVQKMIKERRAHVLFTVKESSRIR